MESGDTQYFFKETRLNLEPSSAASIVHIRVPSPSSNSRANGRKSTKTYEASEDENGFRLKNLAIASSVYHRLWHDSPRSFLWRVLDDGTILNLRAIDVCKQEKAAEAPLILNFHFSAPIQPSCVAFSDPKEHDALYIFVLDTSNYLYSFSLRPDAFRKRSAIESGLGETCKVYLPAAFGFKHPHRLVAATADQILVTMHDGGVVKFDRNKSHDCTFCFANVEIYES
jgi:nuclear pore complex protein Nup160